MSNCLLREAGVSMLDGVRQQFAKLRKSAAISVRVKGMIFEVRGSGFDYFAFVSIKMMWLCV
jgi:hypothetical protein